MSAGTGFQPRRRGGRLRVMTVTHAVNITIKHIQREKNKDLCFIYSYKCGSSESVSATVRRDRVLVKLTRSRFGSGERRGGRQDAHTLEESPGSRCISFLRRTTQRISIVNAHTRASTTASPMHSCIHPCWWGHADRRLQMFELQNNLLASLSRCRRCYTCRHI